MNQEVLTCCQEADGIVMRLDYTCPIHSKISPAFYVARKLFFITGQWEQQPFLLVMVLLISELPHGMVVRLLSESKLLLKALFAAYSDLIVNLKTRKI